jgi:site-specific recombinase XerD
MAINQYQKNQKTFFRVYCQALGKKNKRLRIQRTLYGIESFEQAAKEEKKLIRVLAEEMAKLEAKGLFWDEVIFRWEMAAKHGQFGDRFSNSTYYCDHVNRLRRYTKIWLKVLASDIKKGEGRSLINSLTTQDLSKSKINKVKSSINIIYKWGIEEGLITANSSPVEGLSLKKDDEKVPMILSLDEVQKLLAEAKRRDHLWYHIWAVALLTGMRSGELMALKWSDIELDKMLIRVSRSFNTQMKIEKSTKAGYWRTIPISSELLEIINELKVMRVNEEFVLPRVAYWTSGYAGEILRQFLREIGIQKKVVFHTLRACFATHLLASGVEAVKVMAIGGWQDFKTFQIYVRMAGIEVAGATEGLSVLPPKPQNKNVLYLKN